MRIGLKAKLTALISLLVLLVVVAISALYISSLSRYVLSSVASRGNELAWVVYSKARTAVAKSLLPPGIDRNDFQKVAAFAEDKLAHDPGLADEVAFAIGSSAPFDYVAITDPQGVAFVHSNSSEIGRPLEGAPLFSDLSEAGPIQQLRVIFGAPRKYEFVLKVQMHDNPLPLGAIRVGVSTIFLRDRVLQAVQKPLLTSVVAIVLATLSAGVLSFRLLRPLEAIALNVERMAQGEYADSLKLDRSDEWGILSSKLNLLGERMRGEKAAFVALKENLDRLFSNLADGLMLFDSQNRLVLATPVVARFLGQAAEALLRQPASQIFSGGGPLASLLRDAFRTRRSISGQLVTLPDGSETPRVSVTVQFAGEQRHNGVGLVTLRDASTREQLQNQLDLTAKLAALGKLTSGVAHEVKNPLNAMVLQLEILRSKLAENEEVVKPQIEILSSEIYRLDRVVKTFLDFNRPVELHPSETDVRSLIDEIFTLAEPDARRNNVRLILEPNGNLPLVRLDRDLMKQALLNLVLNGCQAMPAGGQLKVAPHALPNGVELEIIDQGVGISPEAQEKIFNLYFTTKPNGSGVGLAMAYRIIQLHNGSIGFTSEVNRGTTFRVSLPK